MQGPRCPAAANLKGVRKRETGSEVLDCEELSWSSYSKLEDPTEMWVASSNSNTDKRKSKKKKAFNIHLL